MHQFHVNLGDLPTWLAVLAAAIAAGIALWQLRGQQKEIARQVSALERLQANDVDVIVEEIVNRPPDNPTGEPRKCWALCAVNGSRRPLRNVIGGVRVQPDSKLARAEKVGTAGEKELVRWHPGDRVLPLRAGIRVGFVFWCPVDEFPDARLAVRFTDDAGLHWQIDQDLHLEPLRHRDW
jgi:hypothetical protein